MCIWIRQYSHIYHSTVKMKPAVKLSPYTDFDKENNKKGLKFKTDGHVRISR